MENLYHIKQSMSHFNIIIIMFNNNLYNKELMV